MNLSKDAKIYNARGKEVGNLNRFVLDPRTKKVSHIVFEQGTFSKTEHVIPMELVDHIDEQGIHMIPTEAKADELPLFDENEYVITNEHALNEQGVHTYDPTIDSYYYYPSVNFTGPSAPMEPYRQTGRPSTIRGTIPTEETGIPPVMNSAERNIPEESVALKEGAKVISSDHKHVGDVEKVVVDPNSDAATHLIITKGLFDHEKKLIPASWIEQIQEEEVSLAIRKEVIDNLPDYKEKSEK